MTDLRQAAQQALEALEGWEHCDAWVWPVSALEQAKRNTTESLAALRAALEQEHITHITWDERGVRTVNGIPDDAPQQQAEPPPEWPLIKNILAVFGLDAIAFVAAWKAAQRPWVGLTDEEMSDTVADMDVDFGDLLWKVVCLTKIIEAKLKERNT